MGNEAGRLFGVEAISFRVPSGTAPGYRSLASGTPGGVGNVGYNWSSMVSGIYGRFLWFTAQDLGPSSTGNRADGRQLRCLSE